MIDEEDGELKLLDRIIKTPQHMKNPRDPKQKSPSKLEAISAIENKDAGYVSGGAKRTKVIIAFGTKMKPNESTAANGNTVRSSIKESPGLVGGRVLTLLDCQGKIKG
jgi:hypothetical protein